jgi:hypothetical protein
MGLAAGALGRRRSNDADKQAPRGDLRKVLGSGLSQGPPWRRAASLAPRGMSRGKMGALAGAAALGAGLVG